MTEIVNFSIHGDFVSGTIRDLVEEGSIDKAWNIFVTITDDKNIFRNLVKGSQAFNGINEFTLVDTNYNDVGFISLARIVRECNSLKKELKYLNENYKTFEMDLFELVSYKNNLDEKITHMEILISQYNSILGYTNDDIAASLLYKYKSDNLDSKCGWITEKGWFLPVDYYGHDQLVQEYSDSAELSIGVDVVEKKWIRITESMGAKLITIFGFIPKPKQEIMLVKWATHHNLLPNEGDSIAIAHFGGELVKEKGRIKLIKFKD